MGNIISKTYTLKVSQPSLDLKEYSYNKELKVVSKLNTNNNTITFSTEIPEHVFDYLKDTEEQYSTNPKEPEYSFERKKKPFSRKISDNSLRGLLLQFETLCQSAVMLKDSDDAKVDKYIAIRFNQTSNKDRDAFNHAYLGTQIKSSFQFFVCYKEEQKGFDRRVWKTNEAVSSNYSGKTRKWFYYDVRVIENNFQTIKWTQEREDFLQKVQDKLQSVNEELSKFLSNIDDNKIEKLMKQEFLKLTE